MDIGGDRIVLRELALGDLEAVHRITSRPEVCRYQPFGPTTGEETLAYLQGVLQRAAERPRRDYTLAAVLRETVGLVGYASLWLKSLEFRAGEIGFFLHPDFCRLGRPGRRGALL